MSGVRQKREEKVQKVEDSPDISEEEGSDLEAEAKSDSEEDSGSEYGGGGYCTIFLGVYANSGNRSKEKSGASSEAS